MLPSVGALRTNELSKREDIEILKESNTSVQNAILKTN
jgi:hypothetical protein